MNVFNIIKAQDNIAYLFCINRYTVKKNIAILLKNFVAGVNYKTGYD